jgi:hypothetical protein
MRFFAGPTLLVIDELGCLPLPGEAASALFQVVSQRYLKIPIVLTTNHGVASWGEVLGDTTVAAAMLDRLLRRSVVLNLDGDSYRLRDHHAKNDALRQAAAAPADHYSDHRPGSGTSMSITGENRQAPSSRERCVVPVEDPVPLPVPAQPLGLLGPEGLQVASAREYASSWRFAFAASSNRRSSLSKFDRLVPPGICIKSSQFATEGKRPWPVMLRVDPWFLEHSKRRLRRVAAEESQRREHHS